MEAHALARVVLTPTTTRIPQDATSASVTAASWYVVLLLPEAHYIHTCRCADPKTVVLIIALF